MLIALVDRLRPDCMLLVLHCEWPACRLAQPDFVSLVAELGQAQEGAAGLLIEVKGESQQQLQERIGTAQKALQESGVTFGGQRANPLRVESYPFRLDPKVRPLGQQLFVLSSGRSGVEQRVGATVTAATSLCMCSSAQRFWRMVIEAGSGDGHITRRSRSVGAQCAAARAAASHRLTSWPCTHNHALCVAVRCVFVCGAVAQETKVFWDFRKGLIPIIGGSRWAAQHAITAGTELCKKFPISTHAMQTVRLEVQGGLRCLMTVCSTHKSGFQVVAAGRGWLAVIMP